MIDDLLKLVIGQLGFDDTKARGGVGVIFALIKKFGEGGALADLFNAIPGAEDLADAEAGRLEKSEGGGVLGGLGGMLGGVLGDNVGDAMKAIEALQGLDIDLDQGKQLTGMVVDFAKEKAGEDVLDKALSNADWLKKLI